VAFRAADITLSAARFDDPRLAAAAVAATALSISRALDRRCR
jgi:hypothetical protein